MLLFILQFDVRNVGYMSVFLSFKLFFELIPIPAMSSIVQQCPVNRLLGENS